MNLDESGRRESSANCGNSLRRYRRDSRTVRAVAWLCIIGKFEKRAGVVQWQYRSFPSSLY